MSHLRREIHYTFLKVFVFIMDKIFHVVMRCLFEKQSSSLGLTRITYINCHRDQVPLFLGM